MNNYEIQKKNKRLRLNNDQPKSNVSLCAYINNIYLKVM